MPTTSNFGWTTPADTDLVKDGAAAIRTLGNGIDTSMAQLKGGTTGQVLSKTNGTDMAFTWVTQDDANAIQNAIVDAKGDLITATANDTPARLAVGNNGETLVADSAATTGLRWTATPAPQNPIINSGFDIWQRGTSDFTPLNASFVYTADRWSCFRSAGSSGALVKYVSSTGLATLPNALRMQRTSGNTSTNSLYVLHDLESKDSTPYQGKTVTLSFYARAGANYSATSNLLYVALYSGTGTDLGGFPSGWTGAASIVDTSTAITTSWVRYSFTGTVSSSANQIGMFFYYNPTGTASTNDWFDITGVQIDVGNVALPYRRNSATLAGELACAQRYYTRLSVDSTYDFMAIGLYASTTQARTTHYLPVQMRVSPSSIDSGGAFAASDGALSLTATSPTIGTSMPNVVAIYWTVSGATQYRPIMLISDNNASTYLGFNAEL